MNTKLLLTVVTLIAIVASIFALTAATKSETATTQAKAISSRLSIADEQPVRMWSGVIQLSDSNYPDFRLQAQTSAKQAVATECMSEEQVTPRRQGGCIQ